MTTNDVKDNFTEREVERIEGIIGGYLSSEDGINKIDTRIKNHFSTYLRVLKAFLLGLGIFFSVIILSGLITKQNLFVLLHDAMFGTEKPEKPLIEKIKESITENAAISYHRSFMLNSPKPRGEKMLFVAEPGQKIMIYLDVEHTGAMGNRHSLNVWLDDEELYYKKTNIKGGFKDITKYVFHEGSKAPSGQKDLHKLEFNLSDFSDEDEDLDIERIKDTVIIDCVIIVTGKNLDENISGKKKDEKE
jgi:hypothetical protein